LTRAKGAPKTGKDMMTKIEKVKSIKAFIITLE
jgi:hypothetical protein